MIIDFTSAIQSTDHRFRWTVEWNPKDGTTLSLDFYYNEAEHWVIKRKLGKRKILNYNPEHMIKKLCKVAHERFLLKAQTLFGELVNEIRDRKSKTAIKRHGGGSRTTYSVQKVESRHAKLSERKRCEERTTVAMGDVGRGSKESGRGKH